MRLLVSGLMVALLLTSMLMFVFNIHPVKGEWTGTVYIRADGSIDPPDAPIATYDNISYTLTDNITSIAHGLVVERDNIVIDGVGCIIQGLREWPYVGVDISGRNNVTIKNLNIKNFWIGILLSSSFNNYIVRNTVMDNSYGIDLHHSDSNTVSDNNITTNQYGVLLAAANYNNVSFNTFTHDGLYSVFSYGNIVSDNLVNDKPLIYLEGMSNITIADAALGQVILINCYNVTVRNNSISNTHSAIQLWLTNNAEIMNNNLASNQHGVLLGNSQYNSICGNNVTGNGYGICILDLMSGFSSISNRVYHNNIKLNEYGISVQTDGSNNSIYENNITNNGLGVGFSYSHGNFIYRNNISENTCYGIFLYGSSGNNIYENNIKNNSDAISLQSGLNNSIFRNNIVNNWNGIVLHDESSHNVVYENNILSNNQCGVLIIGESSNNNTIYHNNFIQNEVVDASLANIWDNGYPSGGNYWSDYVGVDLYSGPYQNITGSDGMGDIPYMKFGVIDHYPLMGPWTTEGSNVSVLPSNELIVTFENVTSPGITTVSKTDVGPELPGGFKLAGNYYDIKTTANISGAIKLRISYDDSGMTIEEEMNLRLMQWDETLQQWIDVTTLLDTENNVIYGETSHLSIFALITPLYAPPTTYTLTITATTGGTTNPTPGTYTYTAGSSVQVTAIPSSSYVFDHWELNGTSAGSANPYTVIMDNNYNLKAFFVLAPPPLTVSISPPSASILVGQSVTFTSTVSGGTPPYNYQWHLNDNPVSGATSPTWTFSPTTSGIFYVYLKATDSKGNTAQSNVARITVTTVPVGGYSIPINIKKEKAPITPYVMVLAILTIAFTSIKRRTTKK